MEEYNFSSDEYARELRTPEEHLELTLIDAQARSKQLSLQRFTTVDEANEAARRYIETTLVQLEEIDDEARHTEIDLSGGGVHVSNGEWRRIEGEQLSGFGLLYPTNEQTRALQPYEVVTGRVDSITSLLLGEEGDYRIDMYLVAALKQLERKVLKMPDGDNNLVEIIMSTRALVKLDGSAEISIAPLEKIRQKHDLQTEIARHGLVRTSFIKHLNKLGRTLHGDDPYDFTEMTNIKILHRIGALGEVYARKGSSYSTTISKAILDAIGNERLVGIGYKDVLTEDISTDSFRHGSILEVLMPISAEDTTTPTLVIEPRDDLSVAGPVSIPFDKITDFSF